MNVLQMVKIEVLPQVQELKVSAESVSGVTYLAVDDSISNCSSYAVNIVVNGNITDTLYFTLKMTANDMEEALNDIQAIQSIGKMVVKKDNTTLTTSFILLSSINTAADFIPILELESENITLACLNLFSNTNYSVMASLILTQKLKLAEGFYIGYNHTHSIRFTPVLPPNTTWIEFEEEMNELLKWVCEYPTPSASLSILYSNSFEGNHSDIDNSTAFCGGQSKKNPGLVWEESAGLKNHHHVRNLYYTISSVGFN